MAKAKVALLVPLPHEHSTDLNFHSKVCLRICPYDIHLLTWSVVHDRPHPRAAAIDEEHRQRRRPPLCTSFVGTRVEAPGSRRAD